MTKKLLDYFAGDELAASTWQNKYALTNEKGEPIEETPEDMHHRLAREFWRVEKDFIDRAFLNKANLSEYGQRREDLSEKKIYELFDKFKYIVPAGSVMAGAGAGKPVSLSNCFVLPTMPKDSYSSIMFSRLEMVQLEKRRGGTGVDLSNLRPRGAFVNNAAKTSTGAASFMEGFSAINNEVAQQGRRGALMITISIVHPDSPEFVEIKQDLTKVTGANVSVKIPDDFMKAVEKNEDYLLHWPVQGDHVPIKEVEMEYNILYPSQYVTPDGKTGRGYIKKIRAKELWDTLIHCAWNTAEPGILFETTLHEYAPDGVYPKFKMISTNPCGEIPMGNGDSCRLIHVNLSSFVRNPYLPDATIDYDKLYSVFYEATRLGDDLVSLEEEALEKIMAMIEKDDTEYGVWDRILATAKKGRRAGVGFFGLSDMIAMLGLKFCSPESIEVTDKVCNMMMKAELDSDIDMAIERGMFPSWNKTYETADANRWYKFVSETYPEQWERMQTHGRRNISFSTVAPTGTVAMVARASSGIEPVFMPFYMRRRKCNSNNERVDFIDKMGIKFQEFIVVHPGLEEWAKINYPGEVVVNWKLDKWQEVFEKSPWYGSTSPEIDWEKRVELQGVVQKYITHAISSTVNLPNDVTEDEVSKIYLTAWKTGNKGQTIYRDGSRDGILVKAEEKRRDDKFRSYVEAPKRPKVLPADFYTTKVKGELFYVMVGLYLDKPYEIFVYKPDLGENEKPPKQHRGEITKIKRGVYTFKSDLLTIENISKDLSPIEYTVVLFSSMLLRTGANIKYVIKTAQKAKDGINGFTSALVRILSKYSPEELLKEETCPECGGNLVRESGCIICKDCGYSKCL